jgi:hypothetical protein
VETSQVYDGFDAHGFQFGHASRGGLCAAVKIRRDAVEIG